MTSIKKMCTNNECKACLTGEVFSIDANFCSLCGSELETFEVEENGLAKIGKVKDKAGVAASKAGAMAKRAANKGVEVAEKYGPLVVEKAKQVAEDPKVRAAAKKGAIAAVKSGKKFVKSPAVKKGIDTLIDFIK